MTETAVAPGLENAGEAPVETKPAPETKDESNPLSELYKTHGFKLDAEGNASPLKEDDAGSKDSDEEPPKADEGEGPVVSKDEDPVVPKEPVDWSRTLREQPQRISEIKVEDQPAAIKAMLDAALEEQRTEMTTSHESQLTETRKAAKLESVEAEAVEEIDKLRQADPAGYVEWEDKNPELASRYRAIKDGKKAAPEKPKSEIPGITPESQSRMNQVEAIIGVLDEPQYKLLEAARDKTPERYKATNPNVVANVRADIRAILKEVSEPKPEPSEDDEKADALVRGQEDLKKVPKPPLATGSPLGSGLTLTRLQSMSTQEISDFEKEPGGTEEIEALIKG